MAQTGRDVSVSPASARPSRNVEFALQLLTALQRMGVEHLVVTPGARSQALALAAYELDADGLLTLHVTIDERVAGFYALGIARETNAPTALVSTSGSALANLVPAVVEAHHSAVPLILLTGDRPASLRGIRSNQTMHQSDFFGSFATFVGDVEADSADAVSLALACVRASKQSHPGAVAHLNVALAAPLSDATVHDRTLREQIASSVDRELAQLGQLTQPAGQNTQHVLQTGSHTVVVAGSNAGEQAEAFAHAAGLPLLAEVTSGSRFGRECIAGYRVLLRTELAEQIDRVIVFGVPTLSREVPALSARAGVETIVVRCDDLEAYDPGRNATIVDEVVLADDYSTEQHRDWLGSWVVADREVREQTTTVHAPDTEAAKQSGYAERSAYAKAELASMRQPISREMLAEAVWRATWPHDRLVVGASAIVRALDAVAAPRKVSVFSNRGLSGIDGTISTATGVAVASQLANAAGVTRVLLGDLTALHDVGGLLARSASVALEAPLRLLVIVANDGGGSIFDRLEVAETADPAAFDRVMFTPQTVSFEHLAKAYGFDYQNVTTRAEIERSLTAPVLGPTLLEVSVTRHQTRE